MSPIYQKLLLNLHTLLYTINLGLPQGNFWCGIGSELPIHIHSEYKTCPEAGLGLGELVIRDHNEITSKTRRLGVRMLIAVLLSFRKFR